MGNSRFSTLQVVLTWSSLSINLEEETTEIVTIASIITDMTMANTSPFLLRSEGRKVDEMDVKVAPVPELFDSHV